jgi:hypothetical protein
MPSRYPDIASRRQRAFDHGTQRSEFMDAGQIIRLNHAQNKVRGTNRTQCGRCGGYYTEGQKQFHENCQVRPAVPLVKSQNKPIVRRIVNNIQNAPVIKNIQKSKKSKIQKKRACKDLLSNIFSPHNKEQYLKEHFIKRYSIKSVEILGKDVFLGLFDATVSVNPDGLESLAMNIASDYARSFRRDRVTWTLETSDGIRATAIFKKKLY